MEICAKCVESRAQRNSDLNIKIWTDEKGVMHRSALTKESLEPWEGFLVDPPDVIHKIDWDGVAKDLHNQLVQRGLFERHDVLQGQNQLTSAILSALRKRVKRLYREEK